MKPSSEKINQELIIIETDTTPSTTPNKTTIDNYINSLPTETSETLTILDIINAFNKTKKIS